MLRTLLLLFHLILTALRRIIMMSPWKTLGLYVPSSSLRSVCVLDMDESRRTVHTKPVGPCPGIYRYIHVYFSLYNFNHFIPDDFLREQCPSLVQRSLEQCRVCVPARSFGVDEVCLYQYLDSIFAYFLLGRSEILVSGLSFFQCSS